MLDILRARWIARKIDARALDVGDPETNLGGSRQKITVKQGIEQPVAKKLVAELKAAKLKVEAQINGDKLRVSGKKRDDLQDAMAVLRKRSEEHTSELQSTNAHLVCRLLLEKKNKTRQRKEDD